MILAIHTHLAQSPIQTLWCSGDLRRDVVWNDYLDGWLTGQIVGKISPVGTRLNLRQDKAFNVRIRNPYESR